MDNKNLKNPQVVAMFPQQVNSGQVFILDIQETSNKEYTMLYLAQKVSIGSGNELNSLFLGWDGQVFRCLQNFKVSERDNIEKVLGTELKVGNVLPANLNIKVVDNLIPDTWETEEGLQTQEPRKFRDDHHQFPGAIMVDENEQPIYRHTELVMSDKEQVVNVIIEPVNTKLAVQKETSFEAA